MLIIVTKPPETIGSRERIARELAAQDSRRAKTDEEIKRELGFGLHDK